MSHVDDQSLEAKIGLARKAVVDAAYAWRTKADPREWSETCDVLMARIDDLSMLMHERHRLHPMRFSPLGPNSWPG